jgi:hypothetical protein
MMRNGVTVMSDPVPAACTGLIPPPAKAKLVAKVRPATKTYFKEDFRIGADYGNFVSNGQHLKTIGQKLRRSGLVKLQVSSVFSDQIAQGEAAFEADWR